MIGEAQRGARIGRAQRWKLEQDDTGLGSQAFQRRRHDLLSSIGSVQKKIGRRMARIGHASPLVEGCGQRSVRLHQKAEVCGHRRRHWREFRGRQRCVESTVDTHTAQQRVMRVSGQAFSRQLRFRLRVTIDEPGPTGKRPTRSA